MAKPKKKLRVLKQKIRNGFKNPRTKKIVTLVGIITIAVIGTVVIRMSFANTSSTNVATAKCGATVSNYNYRVPFGNAVWNQPVCNLPRYSQSADYAKRFVEWSNINDGTEAGRRLHGRIGVGIGLPQPALFDPEGLTGNFSRNVYYASDATTVTKVQTSPYDSNLDGNLAYGDPKLQFPDSTIPWNPNWRTGEGGDNEIVILDNRPGPTEGRMYTIAGYKRGLAAITQCGPFFREERICGYAIAVARDLKGNYIDYRTYEGFNDERGVGLAMYATLVTPEEVKAGEIRHAMGVAIPNTSFGPVCTKQQLGTAAEGKTCGTAVAPATKFEWANAPKPPVMPEPYKSMYGIDKSIPEGMRFAITSTDAQIDEWIKSQPRFNNDPKKASTAKIFARALRDYGMIVADTSGAGAGIQVSGAVNPVARQQWADLGLDSGYNDDLLHGLVTKDNLYVVEPPTVTCIDGSKSKHFCRWSSATYGTNTPAPQPVPAPEIDKTPPTVTITSPANNFKGSNTVEVLASATDNVGVTNIELLVNNEVKARYTTANIKYSLDTKTLANGIQTVSVKAYDKNNNSDIKTINIEVANTNPKPTPTPTPTPTPNPTPTPAAVKKCDFDKNGKIDGIDLAILLINNSKSVTPNTNGDCTGDGKVDFFDLFLLLSEYNRG